LRIRRAPLVVAALLLAVGTAQAQDETFKDMIAQGDYPALADRLEANLDLDRADGPLRTYLDFTLDYLRRGAPAPAPGEAIVVIRGIKTDRPYPMPATSGGTTLFLPPGIRYSKAPYRKRLRQINRWFTTATDEMGGQGDTRHELEMIINKHAITSQGSVLVSASTFPQLGWGPPFAIIRIPAERAIFNYTSPFTNEKEVLIPFFVLPTEVVAVVDTFEEVQNHPLVKGSPFQDLEMSYTSYCPGLSDALVNTVWQDIEENIREEEPPLHHVVPGEPACPDPALQSPTEGQAAPQVNLPLGD
jgi:hypothetical protein